MPSARTAACRPPPLRLLGTEPLRAAVEFARMCRMDVGRFPGGDGHAVVVFPGLAAGHRSMGPLVRFCERLGYVAYDWGRGFNTGPEGDVDDWIHALTRDVHGLVREHPGKITLIGWSLGGIYAREVAKRLARRVRQVITIGSPFAGNGEETHAGWLYRLLNGGNGIIAPKLAARLRQRPPVPTTSIYSRNDGVVAWQVCREPPAAETENVEVAGSHLGLPWNPDVLAVVADRLSQPEGRWQPWRGGRPRRSPARRQHSAA